MLLPHAARAPWLPPAVPDACALPDGPERSFLQSPGTTARSPASAHFPQKWAFSSETGRRAEHIRSPKASVPPRADLTPSRHGARRLPPRFPGEYTGVHSSPTFSRHPFPAPFHFCASRAALPPRFTLPQLVPPPFAFPSFPQLRASARHFPALRPALRPHRDSRPCVSHSCSSPQISAPRDSFPVFTPRVALFLFLLAPSFTRPAKQTASRLSDSASGFPAARRPPSSGVST